MEKIVSQAVLKYFGAKGARLKFNDSGVVSLEGKGIKADGFVSAMLAFAGLSQTDLEGKDEMSRALTHYWLTYTNSNLFRCPTMQDLHVCFQELNEALADDSYLCGFIPTIADIVVFITIHQFMSTWTYQQKEQYMNISRWASTMQQRDQKLETNFAKLQISRTPLYGGITC